MRASGSLIKLTKFGKSHLPLACAAVVLCALSVSAQAATYTVIDPPRSRFAVAAGINRGGVIAGYDNRGGFLRSADGSYTFFNLKHSVSVVVIGINDIGSVVGWYGDASGAEHGFVRKTDGSVETFDAGYGNQFRTSGINRPGDVCGRFEDDHEDFHGFVRTADGTLTVFDPPGSIATSPASINGSRAIAGHFYNGANDHGFVRAPDGTITVFDPPTSVETVAFGINDDGVIVGTASTGTDTFDFIRDAAGGFTLFDAGTRQVDSETAGASIAAKGTIAGWYTFNTDYSSRGFFRNLNGRIQTFKALHARYTFVTGINGKGAIVGYTLGHGRKSHGFLRTP